MQQLHLEATLPLGLSGVVEYPETHGQFAPTDTLTLLTDGVVEARSASCALFGFDRTAAISKKIANQIAKTAELFGQEDDITVLTLALVPSQVAV